jgi:hypothetical protein
LTESREKFTFGAESRIRQRIDRSTKLGQLRRAQNRILRNFLDEIVEGENLAVELPDWLFEGSHVNDRLFNEFLERTFKELKLRENQVKNSIADCEINADSTKSRSAIELVGNDPRFGGRAATQILWIGTLEAFSQEANKINCRCRRLAKDPDIIDKENYENGCSFRDTIENVGVESRRLKAVPGQTKKKRDKRLTPRLWGATLTVEPTEDLKSPAIIALLSDPLTT